MTSEIITKQFKRGMTVEQIATLHEMDKAQVEEITKGLVVERILGEQTTPKKEKLRRKPRILIDLELVKTLLLEGITLPKIAKCMNVKYPTLRDRVDQYPDLKDLALEVYKGSRSLAMKERHAAKREVAVTTECDGFAENFTIAALMKEEEEMTEAIAEVKQETEERDVRNDKWVHFVANQIEHAKVKTKFDVVQEGQKFIKRTEVRFVIEEVL